MDKIGNKYLLHELKNRIFARSNPLVFKTVERVCKEIVFGI